MRNLILINQGIGLNLDYVTHWEFTSDYSHEGELLYDGRAVGKFYLCGSKEPIIIIPEWVEAVKRQLAQLSTVVTIEPDEKRKNDDHYPIFVYMDSPNIVPIITLLLDDGIEFTLIGRDKDFRPFEDSATIAELPRLTVSGLLVSDELLKIAIVEAYEGYWLITSGLAKSVAKVLLKTMGLIESGDLNPIKGLSLFLLSEKFKDMS